MKIMLNDKVYETIKWLVLIVLPALGALYAALAGLWGWPYIDEVCGTLSAVAAFLGAIIGVSTASYRKDKADGER